MFIVVRPPLLRKSLSADLFQTDRDIYMRNALLMSSISQAGVFSVRPLGKSAFRSNLKSS